MTKSFKIIWNGTADLANVLFGDKYGEDWEYVDTSVGLDIKFSNRIIKVGDEIEYSVRYNQGKGSWDDDFNDQDTSSNEIEPYPDNWILPFGKTHKGKMLIQVPGKYLKWLYENWDTLHPSIKVHIRLKKYIEENIDSIDQEAAIDKS
jgi:uncharacterized protein (DUF3820 family)